MNPEKLRGTKTEQILINSFAGESMARNRYTFFAKQAKEEGFEQIAEIFRMTAENEKEHAKMFYEYLGETDGKPNETYPFILGSTEENLKSAIEGEHEEWVQLYAEGEKVAKEEGFDEISDTFRHVRRAEEHHEKRFKKLLTNVVNETVFKKEEAIEWMCRECGYVYYGESAPHQCPNCHHPRAYFQVLCENY